MYKNLISRQEFLKIVQISKVKVSSDLPYMYLQAALIYYQCALYLANLGKVI